MAAPARPAPARIPSILMPAELSRAEQSRAESRAASRWRAARPVSDPGDGPRRRGEGRGGGRGRGWSVVGLRREEGKARTEVSDQRNRSSVRWQRSRHSSPEQWKICFAVSRSFSFLCDLEICVNA